MSNEQAQAQPQAQAQTHTTKAKTGFLTSANNAASDTFVAVSVTSRAVAKYAMALDEHATRVVYESRQKTADLLGVTLAEAKAMREELNDELTQF